MPDPAKPTPPGPEADPKADPKATPARDASADTPAPATAPITDPVRVESLSGSRVETLSGSKLENLSGSRGEKAAERRREDGEGHAGGLGPGLDTDVAKAVVDTGLATDEEVRYCREQQKNSSDPMQRSLADLLVDNSFITNNQAKRVRRQIDRRQRSNRIPGYDILAEAGRGAMAKVYKARQQSLDRIVAVKVLPKKVSNNPDFVERFYKEGRAAAKLAHQNIVQAFDVGSTPDGYHYFVMEFLEGDTLYDVMQPPPAGQGRTFSEAEVVEIGRQMADALAHAHRRGLIHRDVKPKNILVNDRGQSKLTDLGLARDANDSVAAEQEAGKAYGTPYYISPEQIRGEIDIDHRADIYALGATLYHIAVGRPPYTGDSPSNVMHKHLKEELVPPDHLNPALSQGLSEVIEVCMKKNKDDRYQQTEDLLEDLEAVAAGEPPIHALKGPDLAALADLDHGPDQTVDLDHPDHGYPHHPPFGRRSVWQHPAMITTLAVAGVLAVANLILVAVVLAG